MRLTYVGHATVLMELDGQRFLTDPLLTNWLAVLHRQVPPVEQAVLRDIDAVLLSHAHHDHLHIPSLDRLGRGTRLVVPEGVGSFLRDRGFAVIEEVRPGQQLSFGDVDVQVVQAVHDPDRPLSPVSAEPQGFLLHGSRTVYFAGDTDLFQEMGDLAPVIDLALVPIWGWGPTLGSGHLDPPRAAEAVALIRPKVVIPIHWGTYFPAGLPWRRQETLEGTAREFVRFAGIVAPDNEVRVIPPGASTVV